ncbi:MAG: phage tail tape measure protein [Anaerolineae bacterium]|nr:phage tail tape measure protein [Anaerolineae bacterium]
MALEEAGLKLVAENSGVFVDALGRAHDARGRFVAGLQKAGPESTAASQVVTGALRHIGTVAVDAFMQAGKAAVGFVQDSVKVAGDFEAGMQRFAAVTGDSLDESGLSLKDFRDQFLQLGKDTQYSAAQAEEAAINLAKGGIDPLTISTSGLKGTLDLAAGAEVELGLASEIVAKQLGVWADTGVTGADVANLLAQAANASTVGVEDLALGLANSGGSAKVAGVSFKDLTTTMALIAPNFSSAADAGTSLKTFISRLIPTTKNQAAAMIELGLATEDGKSAFFDAQGQFVGMEKASQMLQNATKDLTQEQKLQALQTIFGQDAIRAAASIAEAGSVGFNDMAAAMKNAGSASEQAAKRQQGFNFAQEQLNGSLETLQIVIGTALLPILTTLLNDWISPGVDAVMAFAQGFFDASDKTTFLKDSLNNLIPGAGELITIIQQVITFITNLATSLQQPSPEMEKLADVFEIAGAVIDSVVKAIAKVVEAIFGEVAKFIDANGKDIEKFIGDAWNMILQIITGILKLIQGIVVPILNAIANFIKTNSKDIQNFIDNTWTFIKTIIDTALKLILGIVNAALKLLQGDVSGALNILKSTINTIWNNIKTIIETLINQIATVVKLVFNALGVDIGNILNGIKGTIESIWNNIKNAITGAVQAAYDKVVEIVGGFVSIGTNIINNIVNGLNAAKDAVINTLKWIIEEAINKIKEFFGIGSGSGSGLNLNVNGLDLLGGRRIAQPTSTGVTRTVTNNASYVRNYNLGGVVTTSSAGEVISRFAVLQAMAG